MEITRNSQTMRREKNPITHGECDLCGKPLIAGQFITGMKVALPIVDLGPNNKVIDTGKMSDFNAAVHWDCAKAL